MMPTSEQALQMLLDGHQRYLRSQPLHQHQEAGWRATLAFSQQPFAVILGCGDSRVPPEIVFDQGLGDLFVVRTAGHVLDAAVLGSVEYALEKLNVPLVVVLGHERCGAVQAAVHAMETGAVVPGHLGGLVEAIKPAVAQVRDQPGDMLDNAVRANVGLVTRQLQAALPALANRTQTQQVKIVGFRHDLDTGDIELLP